MLCGFAFVYLLCSRGTSVNYQNTHFFARLDSLASMIELLRDNFKKKCASQFIALTPTVRYSKHCQRHNGPEG